jgi:hypothetical protein
MPLSGAGCKLGAASETKSKDQHLLMPCGIAIGVRVLKARLRPPRFLTVSRSSR